MAVSNLNLFIVFILLSCVNYVENSKLNVPRVLLPLFNSFSTNFTLEVTDGGCYKWSTSRLDIIQLLPQDLDQENGCSDKVIVSTVSKEPTRNTAIVLAEELQTGQIIRCDVIVDVINSLNMVTTTRELYMEEAPEAFEVRAYDDQGNEFTSLEGVEFRWTLGTVGKSTDNTILRFISFKNSPYETPTLIEKFDEIGLQGHIVLLEGIKTGSAKVSVSLPYSEYSYVKPVEVQLTVVANLLIEPADVYILLGTVVHFKILQMQNNKLEEIKLPNTQYYFDVEDSSIAVADSKSSGDVTGLALGKTRVILRDHNVDETDGVIKSPSAVLNVVQPGYMQLNIAPHKNWAIIVEDHHDIFVELFAQNGHKISIGNGIDVSIEINSSYFHIEKRTQNGTYLSGWGIQTGTTPVSAVLEGVRSSKSGFSRIEPVLSGKADLLIYSKISLNPNEVVLPWDPVLKSKYEVTVKASGGDGNFIWSSSNTSIGVVMQSGLVKTQSHGNFEVTAAMQRNRNNKKSCKFHIIPPVSLEIIEYTLEAEVGQPIFLHVALYGVKKPNGPKIPFYQCQNLQFTVKTSDNNFVYNRSATISPVGVSCATLAIVGNTVGMSKVTVSYKSDGILLEDSVTIASYNPLQVIHPASAVTVLAVGTSRNLVFTGGPRPWLGRQYDHKRYITSTKSSMIAIKDLTQTTKGLNEKDIYVVSVLCKELGEVPVTLSVSNTPVLSNCKQVENTASVKVICGKPRSIYMYPEMRDSLSCPLHSSSSRIVQSHNNIEIEVIVKDEQGREFDNITSFHINWILSVPTFGKVLSKTNIFPKTITENGIVLPHKNIQIVIPEGDKGSVDLTASVVNYRKEILKENSIIPEWPEFLSEQDREMKTKLDISSTINLVSVEDTIVSPDHIVLYNHPENKVSIEVKQGSGYYEIGMSSNSIADVNYNDRSRQIDIIPKHDGELIINLIDLCLPVKPTKLTVNIISIKNIKVEMADKVELGRRILAIVKLVDDSDMPVYVPNMDLIELRPVVESEIIQVNLASLDDARPIGEVHFVVAGKVLGDTKVVFVAGRGEMEVRSASVNVQVFPPLRIVPKNVTVVVGSVVQLRSKGGPKPDSNVEFGMDDKQIADVQTNGLIKALKLGHTRITGKVVGLNPSTGQRVIYSKDTADLYVVPLVGIKIIAPLTRFKVGTTIPVSAHGIPDQIVPSILGSTRPALRFDWSLSNEDIGVIKGVFENTGIYYDPQDQVSIRINGLKPGRVTLRLDVSVPNAITGCTERDALKKPTRVFTVSLDLEVFDSLRLLSPPGHDTEYIHLTSDTSIQLKTNKDSLCRLVYTVQNSEAIGNIPSEERSLSLSSPIITVSENGLLQSYNKYGRAFVTITAHEEFSIKQTVTLVVEVKPVHYMMLNPIPTFTIDPAKVISVLPLGATLTMKASYHDVTGQEFTSVKSELRTYTSRTDLMTVDKGTDNATIVLNVFRNGETVLKVWDNAMNVRIFDYVKLHAEIVVVPDVNRLTVGDVVCYEVPLVVPGVWNVSDSKVLDVDEDRGIVRALREREKSTTVVHVLPTGVFTIAEVTVLPVDDIVFHHTSNLSNSEIDAEHDVELVLRSNADDPLKSSNLIKSSETSFTEKEFNILNYVFSCHLQYVGQTEQNKFTVLPYFNMASGKYSCRIITLSDPTLETSTALANISLLVNIGDVTAQTWVPYLPAVFVDAKELYFNDNKYKAYIVVHGLPFLLDEIKIEAVDPEVLQIGNPYHKSINSRQYQITLLNYHWKLHDLKDVMNITIKSELTKQNIKLPIRTDMSNKISAQCSMRGSSTWDSQILQTVWEIRHLVMIIVSVIVIFIITLYAYSHYIQPVINVNVDSNRSLFLERSQRGMQSPFGPQQNQWRGPVSPNNQRFSPNTSNNMSMGSNIHNRTLPYSPDTVYGDPQSTNTSPLRRTKRFI